MRSIVCLLLAVVGATTAQFLVQQPIAYNLQLQPVVQQAVMPQVSAHRAVVYNAQQESNLPAELLNPFYKNPRIVEALAKESWFTNKEMPVIDREAEKIPRSQIYKIFKNAGWAQRR